MKDHQDDQQDRRTDREGHVANRLADRVRRVERDLVVHARRKALRQPVQFRNRPAVHVERVRCRELRDAKSDRVLPVELQIVAVALRAEFSMPDILQPDQRAVGVRFQNDVVELRRLA